MKALFIGGTGTISASISKLCVAQGWDLYLLNRGIHSNLVPQEIKQITADINDLQVVKEKLGDMHFDVVADFIAYTPQEVRRDVELFQGRTEQYFFISSASAYQKPLSSPYITESTPLYNPFWQYSRNKIACEEVLMAEYRSNGFPVTIIRPSHTYDQRNIPTAVHGRKGSYAVVERIRQGRKVIVPGDGLSLWTLTHSRDFAVAFCGLMGNLHAIGETYQIIGDESLTWNQIFEAIGRAVGKEPQMVHIASETLAALCPAFSGALLGDKSNSVIFDNTKIKRAVPQFQTTIRFDQGVREAVSYMDAHPECQIPDPEFDRWCDALIERYEADQAAWPRFTMD
ncbi:MAG: SDR family oxidoreductase [Clostridiales bacterium]|nr:SDR family oxidoreductase [Clostridiales bacterium]